MPYIYNQPTGSGGILQIRDYYERSDGLVEFYVQAGGSSTNAGNILFSWSTPAGNGSIRRSYPTGAPLLYVSGIKVPTSGMVYYSMEATGTIGLGGPTYQEVYVTRASVPPPPVNHGFQSITHTSAVQTFSSTGSGGSAIIEWQTSFGTNPSAIEGVGNSKYTSYGTLALTNLQPGTAYHCWSRGRNAYGWGGWSLPKSMVTLAGVKMKAGNEWVNAVPYIKDGGVWKPVEPFIKDAGVWKSTRA